MYSYSKIELFKFCKYKYKLRYLDCIKVIPDSSPDNALYLGSGLHKMIETSIDEGLDSYYSNFNVLNDDIITWGIQLEHWANKVRDIIQPLNGRHEVQVGDDAFIGYIDLVTDDCIYDFKFTKQSNFKKYLESPQLHIYAYFMNKYTSNKINKLGYILIPKVDVNAIKKHCDSTEEVRRIMTKQCNVFEPEIVRFNYDENKAISFFNTIDEIENCDNYERRPCDILCTKYCEYYRVCRKDLDYMIIED